nr:PREDICTED: elongator complex protein 6 [Struthio camelus australis]
MPYRPAACRRRSQPEASRSAPCGRNAQTPQLGEPWWRTKPRELIWNDSRSGQARQIPGIGALPYSNGKFTLLRDTRTDGSFLVHHFLSFYLRAGCKVCFVALLQSFSHYNIVAQKLVVVLERRPWRAARSQIVALCTTVVFMAGVNNCPLTCSVTRSLLQMFCFLVLASKRHLQKLNFCARSQYQYTANCFRYMHVHACVCVNISAVYCPSRLQARSSCRPGGWLSRLVRRAFVQAPSLICPLAPSGLGTSEGLNRCLVLSGQGNIVVLVHSSEDSEDEENELVVTSLCHHSDLILWAEGLATGFCKDVHGQLKIIRRASLQLGGEQDVLQIYQYKIQDKNVTFFARGLSAAVL